MHTDAFAYTPAIDLEPAMFADGRVDRLVVLDTGFDDVLQGVGEARWLGDADCELPVGYYTFGGIESPLALFVPFGGDPGHGTATPVGELEDGHPLVEAWRWAESWWERANPVSLPRFEVRQALVRRASGIEVVPSQRRFSYGNWSYKVTVEGSTRWEPESSLQEAVRDDDPVQWVQQPPAPIDRFAATLTRAKLKGRFADTLFSFRATRTIFRPYQFKPVMKLLQTGKDRLLIADEVGLGKTIEAGLVWTELEARGQADRALIVCPSSLLGKWMQEMEQRFNFELEELDSRGLEKFLTRFRENRLPPRFRYITSLERLRTWDGLDVLADDPPELDLIIVDEAHAMRNTGTRSYELGSQLQSWSNALVFLTATPINLRQTDLYNLLDLLVPEDMGDVTDLLERLEPNRALNAVGRLLADRDATAQERCAALDDMPRSRYSHYVQARPDYARLREIIGQSSLEPKDVVEARRLIAELNTLSTVITRTKKSEVQEEKPIRDPRWVRVEWSAEETRFYDEYLEWCQARADVAGMPIQFAMQMPLRLASACLPMARLAVLEWTPALFEDDDEAVESLAESRLVEPHRALVEAAEALAPGVDTKFDKLLPLLEQMVAEGHQTLVFTFSRPTIRYLRQRLGSRFRVAELHGGVDREGRRRVMADFRAGLYDIVIANRVASEGLDFEFCSTLINYDLPWNPMEIEQRIGRIDRIGQKSSKLLVASFHNDATIDEPILHRVLDRIEIFEDSIGALEPIVNREMRNLQGAFDFRLDTRERLQKADQFANAVEENRAGLADVADAATALMVGNDVDVSGLEDTLEKTGKYIGQSELAHLIADWAAIEDAPGVTVAPDGGTVAVRGNAEMARRVEALSTSRRRSRAEVEPYIASLRSGVELHFALDQELARTGRFDLLTATNPLVMAATEVPGHREVRFTHARARRHDDTVPTGTYVVALARATLRPRDESELWATAVAPSGRIDAGPVSDALLAALARGELEEPVQALDTSRLPRLTQRALDSLLARHVTEGERVAREHAATSALRRETLEQQHARRLASFDQRIATTLKKYPDPKKVRGFEGMRRKAIARHADLLHRLDAEATPTIEFEPIAVCVMEVVP